MEAWIPQDVFSQMHPVMLALIGFSAVYFLIKGADLLVEGAAGLALRLGISQVVIGATIVSLGTTSPEAAVSVMAAFSGNAGLALGNGVGSVIADTALIFGLGALMAALPADRSVLSRQGWIQFGSAAALSIFCFVKFFLDGDDAFIGRPVGVILVVCLVVYIVMSIRWARKDARALRHELNEEVAVELRKHEPLWKLSLEGVIGLTLVIFASRFVICVATEGAIRLGISEVVIASTIVALGTSLPELVVGLTAVIRGQRELLVGNIIGADILNILFVIGLSATAADLPIVDPTASMPRVFLYLHLPAMMFILAVFRGFIFLAVRKGQFSRWMGVPLIAMYIAFIVLNYVLTGEAPAH